MSDIDSRISRARRAAELLENPMFVDAWSAVEAEIISRWKDSPIKDKDGQQELRIMLHALRCVKAHFEQFVHDGQIAKAEKENLLQRLIKKSPL